MSSGSHQSAIEVTIEEAGSVAKVVIPADFDPALLDVALLANLVQKSGIAVDSAVEAQLLRVAKTFRDKPSPLEHVIARSTAAIDGQDGRLEWVEGRDPTAAPAAAVGQDDTEVVDYYNQVGYVRVAKGSHVATLHEPTCGEDGVDVTGRTIKAKPGRRYDVKIDPSLGLDESGRIIAQVSGILEYQHGVLRVSPVFEVPGSIDFSTGNIDFDGTVIVRDGVRDRFEVKAMKDIIVDGLIEAATITCGRNFTSHQGMAAKGQGELLVHGDAVVGYLNNVKGRIKGDLTVQRELINCDLVIGGDLICDQGTVIGGNVVVSGSVRVAALGSKAGTSTSLILDLPRTKLEVGEDERTECMQKMSEGSAVDVQIHKVIYRGVCIKIGDVELRFGVEIKGPITIGRDGHQRLYFREGDGPPRPLDILAKIVGRAA